MKCASNPSGWNVETLKQYQGKTKINTSERSYKLNKYVVPKYLLSLDLHNYLTPIDRATKPNHTVGNKPLLLKQSVVKMCKDCVRNVGSIYSQEMFPNLSTYVAKVRFG